MEQIRPKIDIFNINSIFPQFELKLIISLSKEPDATTESVCQILSSLAEDFHPFLLKSDQEEEKKFGDEETKEENYFEDLKSIFPHLKNVVIKQALDQVKHFNEALDELLKESEKLEEKRKHVSDIIDKNSQKDGKLKEENEKKLINNKEKQRRVDEKRKKLSEEKKKYLQFINNQKPEEKKDKDVVPKQQSDIHLQVAALLEILNFNQQDKNLFQVLELHNYRCKQA